MTFLNPWAWIGLAALAAPIAAHLLARRRAARQLFPTLRFLPASRIAPVSRHRLTDAGLLALRCAVVAVAAGALAQPACDVRPIAASEDTGLARAIVIDISASMRRESGAGMDAVVAAQRAARDLAASATRSRIVESDAPADLLAASVNWLAMLPVRREVVIVSDFQIGQIARGDLTRLPDEIGIRLVQIPVRGDIPALARAESAAPAVTILAGAAEREGAGAAWQAAVARGAPVRGAADRPIGVVFPGYEPRGTLLANRGAVDRPWTFDAIAAVSNDPLSHLYARGLSWTTGRVNDRDGVLLMTDAAADSVAAAALLVAAARAAAGQPPPAELTPEIVAAGELARWTREAAPPASPAPGNPESHGRWMWAAVLVLLLIEGVVRRTGTPTADEEHRERAA